MDKASVQCFHYHKLGHFWFECPSWDKEANYAKLEEEEEILLMAHIEMNEVKK